MFSPQQSIWLFHSLDRDGEVSWGALGPSDHKGSDIFVPQKLLCGATTGILLKPSVGTKREALTLLLIWCKPHAHLQNHIVKENLFFSLLIFLFWISVLRLNQIDKWTKHEFSHLFKVILLKNLSCCHWYKDLKTLSVMNIFSQLKSIQPHSTIIPNKVTNTCPDPLFLS